MMLRSIFYSCSDGVLIVGFIFLILCNILGTHFLENYCCEGEVLIV